ncbi:hypothetical protein R6Q57_023486 [Mikania cordata]
MDPASGHSLPPPFHTRNLNLHQFRQQNSGDEQSGTNGLIMGGHKRERDDMNNEDMLNNSSGAAAGGGESSDGKRRRTGKKAPRTTVRVEKQT